MLDTKGRLSSHPVFSEPAAGSAWWSCSSIATDQLQTIAGSTMCVSSNSLCNACRYLEEQDDTSELMTQYKANTDGKPPCHAYMDGPAYILSKVHALAQMLPCA